MHTYPFPIMIEYVKIQFYFSKLKSVQNRPTMIRFQEKLCLVHRNRRDIYRMVLCFCCFGFYDYNVFGQVRVYQIKKIVC